MDEHVERIHKLTLTRTIPPETMSRCLADGSFRTTVYGNKSVVHFDGDVCNDLEILLAGKVSVERIDEAGHLMTVAEFFEGDVLGGNLLFSKTPLYPMTIVARQSTIILAIDKECLFALFTRYPEFLKSYLEYVSDNAAILGDRIKYYVNTTIREGVARFFLQEYRRKKSNPLRLPLTKTALAERLGVQRTSLSRELAKMRTDGLICFNADSVELRPEFFVRYPL